MAIQNRMEVQRSVLHACTKIDSFYCFIILHARCVRGMYLCVFCCWFALRNLVELRWQMYRVQGYTTGHSQGLVSDIITYQMRIESDVCSKLDTALAKNPMSSRHRCHLVHISSLPTTMRKLRHATKCFVLPCLFWV